jgi:hypothetical protein
MARFKRGKLTSSWTVALALVLAQANWSAGQQSKAASEDSLTCKIYSLGQMGEDADLGAWLVQTIPTVIQSSTWRQQGGVGTLSYYAPGGVLVIHHTTAVQAKVEAFLRDVKAALPPAKRCHTDSMAATRVIQASATDAQPARAAAEPPTEPNPYPVPRAIRQPKHLFHFIIRYEGEGVVDSSVVELTKAMMVANQATKEKAEESDTPKKPMPAAESSDTSYSGTLPTLRPSVAGSSVGAGLGAVINRASQAAQSTTGPYNAPPTPSPAPAP